LVTSPFVVAIVQARMSSSRLPGKVMLDLCGKTILERVLDKASGSNAVNEIWLATTIEDQDDIIELVGQRYNVKVFRGQSEDVLDRFCNVVKRSKADIIVRITADNPFTESRLIDYGIEVLINKNLDYVAFKKIPYGAGIEVVTKEALVRSDVHAEETAHREHVTLFIKENEDLFKVYYIESPFKAIRRPDLSVTIDRMEDYTRLYKIFSYLQSVGKSSITLEDVIYCLDHNKN
jgi:spore coat polysaccharide biosynthesis protein SpsF